MLPGFFESFDGQDFKWARFYSGLDFKIRDINLKFFVLVHFFTNTIQGLDKMRRFEKKIKKLKMSLILKKYYSAGTVS